MAKLPAALQANLSEEQLNHYSALSKIGKRQQKLATVLALILGGLGAHKFYQRQWWAAISYLLFSWSLLPILFAWIDIFFIPRQIWWARNYPILVKVATKNSELKEYLAAMEENQRNSIRLERVIKIMLGITFGWLLYVVVATYAEHYRPTRSWHAIPYHYRTSPKAVTQPPPHLVKKGASQAQ